VIKPIHEAASLKKLLAADHNIQCNNVMKLLAVYKLVMYILSLKSNKQAIAFNPYINI